MTLKEKSFSGITLFEVMTAILIFTTGILVLLSMIGSNITWIRTIRLKDDATMLAKEAMEIIYNMRDSNLEKGLVWNCGEFKQGVTGNCDFDMYQGGTGTRYILDRDKDATGDTMYRLEEGPTREETRLYLHTGSITLSGSSKDIFWYNHDNTGKETPYRRFIDIQPVDDYSADIDKVLQIQVNVVADQGLKTYDVVLESIIGDVR